MAQMESQLAGNFVVHLLEDKLRKSKKAPSEMSVAEIVQFYQDTMDLLEHRMTPQAFGAKYGI
ncbi:MAG: hypothetical protein ACE147_09650 [Candidatus Methylomirabilales bacterium]